MAPNSPEGNFSAQQNPSLWQGQQLSTLPLPTQTDLSVLLGALTLATGTPQGEQAVDLNAVINKALHLVKGDVNHFFLCLLACTYQYVLYYHPSSRN
jgi:hypothetical protein